MQVTTQIIDGCKRRNTYYIADTQTNFYIVDNRFFTKNRPPKIAGFLLLLKAICLNNTKYKYNPLKYRPDCRCCRDESQYGFCSY